MKISEKLANFAGKLIGLKPASKVSREIAKAVRDPRISEPVWMMLESIRQNPRQWRVELILPTEVMDFREQLRMIKQGTTQTAVEVKITDRNVGETYTAKIWVENSSLSNLVYERLCRRVTEYSQVFIGDMASYPEWLNIVEARDLHHALCKLMETRVRKVRAREMRALHRRIAQELDRKQQANANERARLTQVYGGSK